MREQKASAGVGAAVLETNQLSVGAVSRVGRAQGAVGWAVEVKRRRTLEAKGEGRVERARGRRIARADVVLSDMS